MRRKVRPVRSGTGSSAVRLVVIVVDKGPLPVQAGTHVGAQGTESFEAVSKPCPSRQESGSPSKGTVKRVAETPGRNVVGCPRSPSPGENEFSTLTGTAMGVEATLSYDQRE